MKKKIINWQAHSKDKKHPGDRRRLGWWLSQDNSFSEFNEVVHNKYEYIYFTLQSDLPAILKSLEKRNKDNQKKIKFIFDFCDSLLSDSWLKNSFRTILYGFIRYKGSFRSYNNMLKDLVSLSDAIVCSSDEQKMKLEQINENVHVIPDAFFEEVTDENATHPDTSFHSLNILWEGMASGNLGIFRYIEKITRDIAKNQTIKIRFVTDNDYYLLGGRYLRIPTKLILNLIFIRSNCDFEQIDWTITNLNNAAQNSDIAIIPIVDDPVMISKPENKLILYFMLGLPTITTATDSYLRVMGQSKLDYCCSKDEEWGIKINNLMDVNNRNEYLKNSERYINNYKSKELISLAWQNLFQSL